MPIGTGIVYNVGDLILSQVSSSGTAFLETKIAAATSSLIYFDSTARINSASLNSITVGTASYVSGSNSIITNLTASNISASGAIIASVISSSNAYFSNIGFTNQTVAPDTSVFPTGSTSAGLILDGGTYTNGLYRTRFVKVDRSSNLPLYIQETTSTSGSFRNLARFGTHANSPNTFEVFGSTNIQGAITSSNFVGPHIGNTTGTASWSTNALTASFLPVGTYNITSSWSTNASTASYVSPTGNAFVQGGNSFGTTALLGTNDAQPLALETNGTTRMTINSNGNVAINTSTSGLIRLNISDTHRGSLGSASLYIETIQNQNQGLATSANDSGIQNVYFVNNFTSSTAIQNQAIFNQLYINGSGSFSGSYRASRNAITISNTASLDSGGNITNTYLTNQISPNIPSFSIPNWIAGTGTFIDIITGNSTGSINNLYNHQIGSPFPSGGAGGITVTNSYGVYINKQKTTNIVTNGWGIYQADTGDLNIFAGKTRIGSTTVPVNTLDVTGNISASVVTASLFGTASWANNVVSASFATTAQTANALNPSNSYTITNLTASNISASLTGSFGIVGIGTNSPTQKLHVVGTVFGTTNGQFGNAVITGTGAGFAVFGSNAGATGVKINLDSDITRNDLVISASTGYVGIGSSSPGAKLDVVGDLRIKSAGAAIILDTTTTSDGRMEYKYNGTRKALIGVDSDNLQISADSGNYLQFRTNGSQRMIITNGGGVGIGTSNPNYAFDVYTNGSADALMSIRASGSANARIYFDAANGDLTGGDYCHLGQDKTTLNFVINTGGSAGNIHLQPKEGTNNGILFVSGSTRFGLVSTQNHQFTGSVNISGSLNASDVTTTTQIGGTYGTFRSLVTPGIYSNGSSTGNAIAITSNTTFANQGAWVNLGLHQTTANVNDLTAKVYLAVGGYYQNSGTGIPVYIGGGFTSNSSSVLSVVPTNAAGAGNVGIGTPNPLGRLHITGSVTNGESLVYLSKGSGSITQHYITAVNQLGQLNYRVSSDINGHASQTLYLAGTIHVYHDSYWSSFINNANYVQGGLGIGTTSQTHGYGVTIARPATSGSLYVSGSSVFTGSVSINGLLNATASWAQNVVSSSFATTAQTANALNASNTYTVAGLTSAYVDVNGSATIPSTGIYRPSSKTLGLSADATLILKINGSVSPYVTSIETGNFLVQSGNVGIGIANPVQKLHIDGVVGNPATTGTTQNGIFRLSNTTDNAVFDFGMRAGGNGAWIQSTDETSLAVNYSLLLNPNGGNVGIGTTNATDKLTLYGELASYKTGADTIQTQVYLANAGNTRAFNLQLNSGGTGLDLWSYNSANDWLRHTTFNYDGNVGIGTAVPTAKLEISGSSNSALLNIKSPISGAILYVSGSGAVGIGTSNVGAFTLQVNGSFGATTKSFIIDHPTKEGKKLMYGSLESPYHGIRLTGRDTLVNGKCKIQLPEYMYKLILHDSVNIQLTGIKCNKTLYIDDINIPENYFTIAYDKAIFESYKDYDFFWDFTAIRADVPELQTEM